MSNICILHNLFTTKCNRKVYWKGILLPCKLTLSQPAGKRFPVTVSPVRCPDPVNAARCKRMRNPHREKGCAEQKVQSEENHIQEMRIPGSGYHCTVSGILDKFPHSSSPSCHVRYLLTCEVCLWIWQPGASACRSPVCLSITYGSYTATDL